jgi:hypothetical protein
VEEDFMLLTALIPLQFMCFRSLVDEKVLVSEASSKGNGLCISSGVTEKGKEAVRRLAGQERPPPNCRENVLLAAVFDNVGCMRRSFEVAGMSVCGSVSIEEDAIAQKCILHRWPDTVVFNDVTTFGGDEVRQLRLKFPNTITVVIGGGIPGPKALTQVVCIRDLVKHRFQVPWRSSSKLKQRCRWKREGL